MKNLKINVFSLLYFDDIASPRPVNLSKKHKNPEYVYARCALMLSKSCCYFGISYKVLTNNKDKLLRLLGGSSFTIEVEEIDFIQSVPKGINFYSAHFKIDAFRYFSRQANNELYALVDLDAVMLRSFDLGELKFTSNQIIAYNIGMSECASFGEEVVYKSIYRLIGEHDFNKKWFGGEFIMSLPSSYSLLVSLIDEIWSSYISSINENHHVGDEIVVTAALIKYEEINGAVIDSDCLANSTRPLVTRWWSARTLYKQPRLSELSSSFLHLPSDKDILVRLSFKEFQPTFFMAEYMKIVSYKLLSRKITSPLLNFTRKEKKYASKI